MADGEKQSFLVQAEDGRKFKMVIKGDLGKIPVEKIKRYLKAYGVPDGQTLTYDGKILSDNMVGDDFGLQPDSVLRLWSGAVPTLSQAHASIEHSSQLAVDVEGRHRQQLYEQQQLQQLQQQQQHAWGTSSSSHGGSASHPFPEGRPHRTAPELPTSPTPVRNAPFGWSPGASSRLVESGARAAPPAALSHHAPGVSPASTGSAPHPLQQQVQQLESDNARLRREVEALKLELEAKRTQGPVESLLANAKANLHELGKELGLHLTLDQNLTCVIGNDEKHTILATFDAPTERLYVYSTLLTFVPHDAQVRLRLFEVLLEGALLGRDVAGGGIGVSLQSNVVMLSTSIALRHAGPGALREVVPVFVEALVRWRAVVAELLQLSR